MATNQINDCTDQPLFHLDFDFSTYFMIIAILKTTKLCNYDNCLTFCFQEIQAGERRIDRRAKETEYRDSVSFLLIGYGTLKTEYYWELPTYILIKQVQLFTPKTISTSIGHLTLLDG